MSNQIAPVQSIDPDQWKTEEYDLLFHLANFARMANSVETAPGPMQGWFKEALWRHYSYAPFNCRVMENYYSLAFFYGYKAAWNPYYRNPAVLERLAYTLEYTFARMGDNGAIPEYAPAALDTPMLAPSSFGMEYMSAALEVAGAVLPQALRQKLTEQARKAAVYVLTSEESWEHARSFTNQFLGAMAGGARIARLTKDEELMQLVTAAGDALVEDFCSPLGFLYEADGPETFSYFFVTLKRLAPLYREWPDARVLEAFKRHCGWMRQWMLTEPNSSHVILSTSHQTRTSSKGNYLARPGILGLGHAHPAIGAEQQAQKGLAPLMNAAGSDGSPLVALLASNSELANIESTIFANPQRAIEQAIADGHTLGYPPVSVHALQSVYAPDDNTIANAKANLPCNDPTPVCQVVSDERGNQYAFYKTSSFASAFAFGQRRSAANFGPAYLWTHFAGTIVLAYNGEGPAWETQLVGTDRGTAKELVNAKSREGRGGLELWLQYADLGLRKGYLVNPKGINVQLSGNSSADGHVLMESIPLLLRASDNLVMDYGHCRAETMSARQLGIITQRLTIERAGKPVMTLDMGEPVSMTLTPTYDEGGYVRCLLQTMLAPNLYHRSGYSVILH